MFALFFFSPLWSLGVQSIKQSQYSGLEELLDWCDFYLPASLNAMGWNSTQCALVSMFFSLFAEKSQGFYVVYC